jgi:hypothetical protein
MQVNLRRDQPGSLRRASFANAKITPHRKFGEIGKNWAALRDKSAICGANGHVAIAQITQFDN